MKRTLPKTYPPVSAEAKRKAAKEKADGFIASSRGTTAQLRSRPGGWGVILASRSIDRLATIPISEARRIQGCLDKVLDAYDGRHDL